jgi:hypothetical protein
MNHRIRAALAAILITAALPAPALADAPIASVSSEAEQAKFAADRRNILAMAGNYKVTFDFRETTPWQAGYTPIPPKTTSGHESVRVIEDTGRKIVLQHLLIVEDNGKTQVVKHWRQDWTYEPDSVLVYAGQGKWNLDKVSDAMRKGR